jgi:hypothetical protein
MGTIAGDLCTKLLIRFDDLLSSAGCAEDEAAEHRLRAYWSGVARGLSMAQDAVRFEESATESATKVDESGS